jgi:hypothetical protein
VDGEHGVEGFVGEGGERGRTTFKASREAQTVVAGEGGDVRSARGGKGLCSMILYGKSFNLKTIFKAILATLERIIQLFSLKWPKSP